MTSPLIPQDVQPELPQKVYQAALQVVLDRALVIPESADELLRALFSLPNLDEICAQFLGSLISQLNGIGRDSVTISELNTLIKVLKTQEDS